MIILAFMSRKKHVYTFYFLLAELFLISQITMYAAMVLLGKL